LAYLYSGASQTSSNLGVGFLNRWFSHAIASTLEA
jgi:hypothetical protein